MLDPHGLYQVNSRVAEEYLSEADEVLMVHCFDGYLDAGVAGHAAVAHLLAQFPHDRLVTFDTDQIMDYHTKRPMMTYSPPSWVSMVRTGPVVDALRDANGTTVLVMHGMEPDMQWERFSAAAIGIVDRFGISATCGMYGIPMAVPHTRALRMSATSTNRELVARYPSHFGPGEVPGSLSALMELRMGEAGLDALTYLVHVPHYLATIPHPSASRDLLAAIEAYGGLDLCTDRLQDSIDARDAELQAQVGASPQLARTVISLERRYDSMSPAETLKWGDGTPVPSASEIAQQFEAFLMGQADDSEGSGSDSEA